jgi:hypothetical protein
MKTVQGCVNSYERECIHTQLKFNTIVRRYKQQKPYEQYDECSELSEITNALFTIVHRSLVFFIIYCRNKSIANGAIQ